MEHFGDITKINGAEAPVVDCIIGGSPCFPAGTLVLTQSGYKPIEDIRVGELVYTHLGNWKPVVCIGNRLSKTVKMKGNHYGLIATPDHPFYSATQEREWNNEDRVYKRTLGNVGKWTPAKEMEKKRWATPSKITGLGIPPFERNPFERNIPILSRDFMYIIGRWLGDGWLRDGQRPNRAEGQTWGQVLIYCARDESFYLETVLNDTFRDCGIKVSRIDERTVTKFRLTSHTLVRWLRENFGERSTGKRIPSWVYCMEEKYQLALLDGYFESDGHQYKRNTWKTTTVSKKLAFGMKMLGDVVGYSTAVNFSVVPNTKTIEGRIVHQNPFYTVSFRKENRVGVIEQNQYRWYLCRSVAPYSESQIVYNITVEDDHSYIVEGYIVHNCQDLSIAGNRAGLAGERSGLYMDQIRIIKEMRENDRANGKQGAEVRPRYMVWENVPGAFSSNKGEDFKAVLEEAVRVVEPEAPDIPAPKKGWPTSGCLMGDGWSVAWRVLDAQFWGVPQRRRRIALIADFGGRSAPEILFEREGVHGNYPAVRQEREASTSESETGADCASGVSYAVRIRGGVKEVAKAL